MALARHVVLVIVDGLRPDAIDAAPMPALAALRDRYWVAAGRTVRPSITVAALTSLATGVAPDTHGLVAPGLPPLARVAALRPLPLELKKRRLQTAVIVGDVAGSAKLLARTLLGIGGVGTFVAAGREPREIAAKACATFAKSAPALTVLYLDHCDRAGHAHGWMSPEYLDAACRADAGLGVIADLIARDDVLLLVCADHGGGGVLPDDHDAPHPINDAIPIIAAGAMVARGRCGLGASLLDIPATVLDALGLGVPGQYTGKPLECFAGEAVMSR